MAGQQFIEVCWFSVKMRGELPEWGFRPTGGDFQGMGIYALRLTILVADVDYTSPHLGHRVDESIRLSLAIVGQRESSLY